MQDNAPVQDQDLQNQPEGSAEGDLTPELQDQTTNEPMSEPQDQTQDQTPEPQDQGEPDQDMPEPTGEPAVQEAQQPEPQPLNFPLELEKEIIYRATQEAQEVFKQLAGKDYDEFEANPAEKMLFSRLVEERAQVYRQQVSQQLRATIYQQNEALFWQITGYSPEDRERVREYLQTSVPFAQALRINEQFIDAVVRGDFATARKIFDDLRVKALGKTQKPQRKPDVRVPHSEPPSPEGNIEPSPPSVEEEVWSFFS